MEQDLLLKIFMKYKLANMRWFNLGVAMWGMWRVFHTKGSYLQHSPPSSERQGEEEIKKNVRSMLRK